MTPPNLTVLRRLVEAVDAYMRDAPPLATDEDRAEYWTDLRDHVWRMADEARAALAQAEGAIPPTDERELLRRLLDVLDDADTAPLWSVVYEVRLEARAALAQAEGAGARTPPEPSEWTTAQLTAAALKCGSNDHPDDISAMVDNFLAMLAALRRGVS